MHLIVRRYEPGDEHGVIRVFASSVRTIAPAKYSEEQVRAWLAGRRDPIAWAKRMRNRVTFVACNGNAIVGWIEMEADGHVDFLYCSAEAAGKSVAGGLYDALLPVARELGLRRLFSEASHFAESFFSKRGWTVDAREVVVRETIEIARARMSLVLPEKKPAP